MFKGKRRLQSRAGFTPFRDSADKVISNLAKFNRKISRYYKTKSVLQSRAAFTLIELMLVVIIIGALAAMVIPRLAGRGEQAKMAAARSDVTVNIATALKLYELDNGNFPDTSEGLNALLAKPSSAANWNGPYLERKPVDQWGREYLYKSPGEHRKDYDLYSLGKDGVEGKDDVNNWE